MTTFKKTLVYLISLGLLLPTKTSAHNLGSSNAQIKLQILLNQELDFNASDFLFNTAVQFYDISAGLKFYDEFKYKKQIYKSSQNFSKRYGKTLTDCEITKKQEGKMWCWLACLQGLLKYHGINKSQKEIFEKISNEKSIPILENDRNIGLSIYSSKENMKSKEHNTCKTNNVIFPSMIGKYIEEVSDGKLTYQVAYIQPNSSEDNIKSSIKDIYEKIGKKPFSLLANHTTSGHFVNILKIDNNDIMHIEDPAFEKGRTELINSYIKHFDPDIKRMVNNANGIPLGFITEKRCKLSNLENKNYKLANK